MGAGNKPFKATESEMREEIQRQSAAEVDHWAQVEGPSRNKGKTRLQLEREIRESILSTEKKKPGNW